VAVPLLLVVGNISGLTLIAAAAGFAFFHFMTQPTYNSLIANYTPARWRGRMFGIYFFATYGGGSFSASILGYVADRLGTNWVFIASAGFGLVVVLCASLLLARALRRSGGGLNSADLSAGR
jgi:MFS family permease